MLFEVAIEARIFYKGGNVCLMPTIGGRLDCQRVGVSSFPIYRLSQSTLSLLFGLCSYKYVLA